MHFVLTTFKTIDKLVQPVQKWITLINTHCSVSEIIVWFLCYCHIRCLSHINNIIVWSEEKTPWHIIVMHNTKTNSNTWLLISMGGRIRRLAARCSVTSAWLLTISIVLLSRRTWNVLMRFLNFALSTLSLPIRHLTNVVYISTYIRLCLNS